MKKETKTETKKETKSRKAQQAMAAPKTAIAAKNTNDDFEHDLFENVSSDAYAQEVIADAMACKGVNREDKDDVYPDKMTIDELKYFSKTYDGITDLLAKTKQRMHILRPNVDMNNAPEIKELESTKGKVSRKIENHLKYWPVWNEWLKNVPGVGPFAASNLIMLYYYKWVPVCPKCNGGIEKKEIEKEGKKYMGFSCEDCQHVLKGEGLLKHKIKMRDFDTVSKWWKFMGRHVDPDTGKMPKRQKGVVCDWSTQGRTLTYLIGESMIKVKGEYAEFYRQRKTKREKTHPNATKGHRHNMAKHEMAKLFLSHFWHVARTIDGKQTKTVYAEGMLGHENIIPPYYWNGGGADDC
jgi:hypothetical protein